MSDKTEHNLKNLNIDNASYAEGLNNKQVEERIRLGARNARPKKLTRSVPHIVLDNIFTLFNVINIFIASLIIAVGSYKNSFFLGVVISNTVIGIFQEIRAKLNIDKLAIITQTKVTVVREGGEISIPQEDIVIDDIMRIGHGNQICSDGEIVFTNGLEVDESQLTGEADPVLKKNADIVLSGSYVVAGSAYVRITAVGSDNYAEKLSLEAKKEKRTKSELMIALNTIIKFLSIAIIPIGFTFFCKNYFAYYHYQKAVLASAAVMIGMIPEGLILLTSIAFAVSTIRLSKLKTLVRSMPCIETLARIDVLCLDKTGTITNGGLKVSEFITNNGFSQKDCYSAISNVIYSLESDNATSQALKNFFDKCDLELELLHSIPFSSLRKWSGCSFKSYGTLILGAPEIIFSSSPEGFISKEHKEKIDEALTDGLRVLALAHSSNCINKNELPPNLKLMALILLSDDIRPDATQTFDYFYKQGVTLKVISGDNPLTVSSVAKKAGLKDAEKYIDMSKYDGNYTKICEEYTVFGRVSPHQKKYLIKGLQQNGHTVAMTGDGVNDVLALKEADCSIAMAAGSDAARCISDFVLLDSNFSAMVNVVDEGCRVVNNIERVAALYLVKTIYSVILSIMFFFIPHLYPFQPVQLSPISGLSVGIPSFFLALRPNHQRIKGRFISNVLENSLPAALLIVLNIIIILIIGTTTTINLTYEQTSTICVLMTGVVSFILLITISKPLNIKEKIMIIFLATAFACVFVFFRSFFVLSPPFSIISIIYIPLILLAYPSFIIIRRVIFILKKSTRFSNLLKYK